MKKTEIFMSRKIGDYTWIEVTKGRKYLTLKYFTCIQGDRDVIVKYDISAENELLETLNDNRYYIDREGVRTGPNYISIKYSDPVR